MTIQKVNFTQSETGLIEYESSISGAKVVYLSKNYVLVESDKQIGSIITDPELEIIKARAISAGSKEMLNIALLDWLALIRYRKETAGIELAGVPINTAINDQNRISNAYSSLLNGLIPSTRFKGANGWQIVTAETFAPIATAVAQHVDKLFNAEGIVSEQLEGMAFDELQSVDIEQLFNVAIASLEQEAA